MRKTAKRVEEEPIETADVSPPKKSKLKEKRVTKEATQTLIPERLPRAAKTRAAQANNNVENFAEATKKPRARGKGMLRRSVSSEEIASMSTGTLKKSKSAEDVDQQRVPMAKKGKNVAKKPAAKKAGNEPKGRPRGKAVKEVDLEEGSEDERPVLIAKKAYGRGAAKKVTSIETKEADKPKKRAVTKEVAPTKKVARGRGKPVSVEVPQEDEAADEQVNPGKGRKGKANGKKAATAAEEHVEADEEENTADVYSDDTHEVAKGKKGKKPAVKRPRGKKAASSTESDHKDVEAEDEEPVENASEDSEVSKEEAKLAKGGKRGKAPAPRNRGKKTATTQKDSDSEDEKPENDVNEDVNNKNVDSSIDEPQQENDKSMKNGKTNSSEDDMDAGPR